MPFRATLPPPSGQGLPQPFWRNAYRPVYLLWFRINDAIFGQHAAGWHFTSVVAHVVATYCVFLLAYRIFGEWPAALFSGLIFGLHPVHIESVAWISGVDDPLVAALLIPAYLCWLRSREAGGGGGRWLGVSLALYALAMLIKETAIVLPLILFASQWLDFPRPLEPRPRGMMQKSLQVLKVLLPFHCADGCLSDGANGGLKGVLASRCPNQLADGGADVAFLAAFLCEAFALAGGLESVLRTGIRFAPDAAEYCPSGLGTAPRCWGALEMGVPLAPRGLGDSLADLSAPSGSERPGFRQRKLRPQPVPVLALRRIRHARRRGVEKSQIGKANLGVIPSSQVWICLGLALLMGFAIQVEDRYYASDAAFYSFAYSRMGTPDPVIGMDYANTLAEQGDFGHAAAIYQKLIQAHPDMWGAVLQSRLHVLPAWGIGLGRCNICHEPPPGIPRNAGAVFYLGLADLKLNRMDEAEANLRRAIVLAPSAPNYHFALGIVLKVKGNLPGAMAEFSKELELNPGHQAAAQQAAEIQRQVVESRNRSLPKVRYNGQAARATDSRCFDKNWWCQESIVSIQYNTTDFARRGKASWYAHIPNTVEILRRGFILVPDSPTADSYFERGNSRGSHTICFLGSGQGFGTAFSRSGVHQGGGLSCRTESLDKSPLFMR